MPRRFAASPSSPMAGRWHDASRAALRAGVRRTRSLGGAGIAADMQAIAAQGAHALPS
jgi:hypothetical protein